jgi:hypothetical protein
MNSIKRILNYEYWPFWVFYIPAIFYGLGLAVRARSITYFTTVNPCMKFSGSLENSKSDYLKYLPKKYLPKTQLIDKNISRTKLVSILETQFEFPLLLKPDSGQRGVEIEKIYTLDQLLHFLKNANRPKFLIQEFIALPIELGILIAKEPNSNQRKITSVTLKKFLTIKGDGVSTFQQLVKNNIRACKRKKEFQKRFNNQWNDILAKNQEVLLEPIGNHNKGTEFLDGSHLKNETLLEIIDNIVSHIPKFYYGRLDIKVKSIDHLMNGKEIKVLEINGVNSEPTHIYDKNYSLFKAYKEVFLHMELIYDIGHQNRIKGVKMAPLKDILKGIYQLYNH